MTEHKTGTREEWLAARLELLDAEKELTANLQLMNTGDHYGITDVEWDSSGRFVATWASAWKHSVSVPRCTDSSPLC